MKAIDGALTEALRQGLGDLCADRRLLAGKVGTASLRS